MAEKENKIIETISKALPSMSELEKEKLLAFSEGIAYVANLRKDESA